MSKILLITGKKQSGKSSLGSFISAYIVTQLARANPSLPLPKKFYQDDNGDIVVDTAIYDESGNKQTTSGILDFHRIDPDFINFATQYIWPHIKLYSFAETLKIVSMEVFGLTYDQCFGTNDDKETDTNILWSDMRKLLPNNISLPKTNSKYVSARDFLKYFGTNVCRTLYDNCWINNVINRIHADNPNIAVIEDGRFVNEVNRLKLEDARIIKLTRTFDNDSHASEQELDTLDDSHFDLVINNSNLSIQEKNQCVLDALYNFGFLNSHIGL